MRRQTLRELKRGSAKRKPRLRILAVSEGAKTEGLYLSLFVKDLRAANVQIDILGRECGSDPLTVVEFARDRFLEDRTYDICYCIVDRDSHPLDRFNKAKQLSANIDGRWKDRSFCTIVSDPCIEYWFLLHFLYTRTPFASEGNKSRGDKAVEALKLQMPSYSKSDKSGFESLVSRTDEAIENSRRALADANATGDANPSTQMHDFVVRIRSESL